MRCREVQAWDGERWGTGLTLETSQQQTTHLWSVKEMQIRSRTRVVLGVAKRAQK